MKEYENYLKPLENLIHDIRMPITIMYSKIQLLEGCVSSDKEADESINSIKRNLYRVVKLLNDLSAQSKIIDGELKPRYKNLDIVSIMKEVTEATDSLAKNKNIKIVFKTSTDKKICALDKVIIERILLNLISNGIKYTPAKTKILVKLEVGESDIKITVKDNGNGMDKKTMESLFDRKIKSVDEENKPLGSGIGLSIVKDLTNLIGGKLSVKSNKKGTEISVSIPDFTVEVEAEDLLVDDFYSYNIFQIELSEGYDEF